MLSRKDIFFDVSARVDGTTKFGPGKRWGVFPAVSGRWNVVDEPWMEGTRKWLSMLSIRPGWGMTGNQPNKDYCMSISIVLPAIISALPVWLRIT